MNIGVVLAGGASSRMGGKDKAEISLAGRGLFEHVASRVSPQVDELLVAGGASKKDFTVIPDQPGGPEGPLAGLYATVRWLSSESYRKCEGFMTVPIDAPFLPLDLYARLTSAHSCAVASAGGRLHPTFAYWNLGQLRSQLEQPIDPNDLSLHTLARKCGAMTVDFPHHEAFFNVNTPADLDRASEMLDAIKVCGAVAPANDKTSGKGR